MPKLKLRAKVSSMITKYKVNDWNFKARYWDPDALVYQATKWPKVTLESTPCTRVIPTQERYEAILAISQQHVPASEKELNNKFFEKWNVSQGKTPPVTVVQEGLSRYYETPVSWDDAGARFIRETMYDHFFNDPYRVTPKLILNKPREVFNKYKADHFADGGIQWHGDKRDYDIQQEGIWLAMTNPLYLDPVISNHRDKDGKIRNVFADPLCNLYKEIRYFSGIFDWWIAHPMDHRMSDVVLAYFIPWFKAKCAYAGDYKGMDFHLNDKAFHLAVDIACDQLHATNQERDEIHEFVDELMHVECITGDEIWCGLHNLFSGMWPTHNIEGILNYSILVTACRLCGYVVVTEVRPLKKNEAFILVCGDDSIVLFGSKLSPEELQHFGEVHAQTAQWVGQEMELSKIDYGYDRITFCKKTLALNFNAKGFKKELVNGVQVPLWKASLPKAVHALYQPENLPSKDWTPTEYVLWMCSIMDGVRGCEQYEPVLRAVFESLPFVPSFNDFTEEAIGKALEVLNKDWWFRNFGQINLMKSPTFIRFRVWFKL